MDEKEILDNYHDKNNIHYELRAITGDGRVIAKKTSSISADDLVMDATSIDDAVQNEAIESYNSMMDMIAESEAERFAEMQHA